MGIQKEIWISDIQEQLYANNDFIKFSVSHDGFVENKTVHVPQAGTIPSVQKDRAILPITIDQRTDTDRTYNLSKYDAGAILIEDIEKIQVNYDKRMSVMRQYLNAINDRLGLEFLYQMLGTGLTTAGGQIVLSSGSAASGLTPPGGTGNRLQVTLNDIKACAAKLGGDDVPGMNRYMVMPSVVYWDFVEANKAYLLNMDYNKSLSNEDIATGVVGKVYGFKIIERSYTAVYADAATPTKKAVGAATAATDCWACVAWQQDMVARAKGAVTFYEDVANPVYQGDVYSAAVLFAATTLRTDGKGIVTLVQNT